MFWQNEEFAMGLGRDIHLDGVVCVVDAVFGRKQMEEDHADDGIGESLRQIAGSDVILLNKVDMVPSMEADATEDVIRKVNPAAAIYRTIRGEIDLKHIMGIDAYTSRPLLQGSTPLLHPQAHNHEHNDADPSHSHGPTHYEVRGISSMQVVCPTVSSTQLAKLDEWIQNVLWENRLPGQSYTGDESSDSKLEILRCKGMFVTDKGETYVLQGVRSLYEIAKVEKSDQQDAGVPEVGKIVFIGKGLNERVRSSLEDVVYH